MDSNFRFDYDTVIYLDQNGEVINRTSIIYSSQLKHEFLAMMNANFAKSEPKGIANLMPEYLPGSEVEMMSLVGIFQLDEESNPSDRFDLYTYIDKAKVCVLRVPPECSQIRFESSQDGRNETIDFSNESTKVGNQDVVEKLVVLATYKEKVTNLVTSIHESSGNPHSELYNRIVTSTKFYDNLSLTEIDPELLYDNKSLTKLGEALELYFSDFDRVKYDSVRKLVYINGV